MYPVRDILFSFSVEIRGISGGWRGISEANHTTTPKQPCVRTHVRATRKKSASRSREALRQGFDAAFSRV